MQNKDVIAGISVVVCCYNSAPRIEETLRHLAFQKQNTGIDWEVVLVDNRSSDNTQEVARKYWGVFGPQSVPLIIIAEQTPGLSYARNTGVINAKYETVIFCDDDNWLPPDYLSLAFSKISDSTKVGVLGGWCDGAYEIPFKSYLSAMSGSLAIGRHGRQNGEIESVNGAGMIFQRSAYLQIMHDAGKSLIEDRKGNQLTSGGDTELCWRFRYAGFSILFDEALHFVHFMPAQRLRTGYFFRLTLLNVIPGIVLNQYKHEYKNPRGDFGQFMRSEFRLHFKHLFYFFPRMIIGKYKFHSLIYFLQSSKIIVLLIVKPGTFRQTFDKIKKLRKKLSTTQL